MVRLARITALLLTVALLATPLGATVCAGHCAQPQPVVSSPASHCGSATTEGSVSAQGADGARLTAVNPCGVKSVPTVLKSGDDPTRLQLVQPAQPFRVAVIESGAVVSIVPQDTSPPDISAPHLTPLRI